MNKLLGLDISNRQKLTCYRLPLWDIGQRLPFDLLGSGISWIWQSERGTAEAHNWDLTLPDRRGFTLLTEELADAFARECAEGDDELRRQMLVVGFANESDAVQATLHPTLLRAGLQTLAEFGDTPIAAVIFQCGDMGGEDFVFGPHAPAAVGELLRVFRDRIGRLLRERLGIKERRLVPCSGNRTLKEILLWIQFADDMASR